MDKYIDRHDAGKRLAKALQEYANQTEVIVLALPRGGVPVAYEVAQTLHAPLDVFIVRKLGAPTYEELAFGAIAMGNTVVFNDEIVKELAITPTQIQEVISTERAELRRREAKYRGDKPFPQLAQQTIILVDDGIATGATMRAAIQALRTHQPLAIIVAVPVAPVSSIAEMEKLADKVICPMQEQYFNAVGQWYEDFPQTMDEEVHQLLAQSTI